MKRTLRIVLPVAAAAVTARVLRCNDGSAVTAQVVILGTGFSYRRLAAPGLEALTCCGVFYG